MNEGRGKSQYGEGTRKDSRRYGRDLGQLLTVQIEGDYNALTMIMSEAKDSTRTISRPSYGLGYRARERGKSSE